MTFYLGVTTELLAEAEELLRNLRYYNTNEPTRCRDFAVCITQLEDVRNRLYVMKVQQGEEGRLPT